MQALVRSATLSGYLDLARSLDLDPVEQLGKVGLDAADLAVPEKWISAPAVARLLASSAAATERSDFALLLAERRRLTTLGPLSLVLREEPSLREVVDLLIRYERSYNEALHLGLTEQDGIATMRLWFEFGEPAPGDQALTLALAALHSIIAACVGPSWRPVAVCFAQPAPDSLETFRVAFGPALRFDHEFTGLVLYASDLAAPNVLADPLMRPYVQQILDTVVPPRATSVTGRVRELVEFLLPLGRCTVDHVARALGVDARTLQRHLATEGQSFSSLLHATRAAMAERHLATDRSSLTEVSEALGFVAPSAFSRWFGQQFGMTPSQWRRNQAPG